MGNDRVRRNSLHRIGEFDASRLVQALDVDVEMAAPGGAAFGNAGKEQTDMPHGVDIGREREMTVMARLQPAIGDPRGAVGLQGRAVDSDDLHAMTGPMLRKIDQQRLVPARDQRAGARCGMVRCIERRRGEVEQILAGPHEAEVVGLPPCRTSRRRHHGPAPAECSVALRR